MSPYLAEFIGTFILILLGNGVVGGSILKGTKSHGAGWFAIVTGWGLAVTLAIYAVGNYSGAHINPAVTLSFAIIGKFEWALVPGYMLAQLGGAFTGACLVGLFYLSHFKITDDAATKQAVFCTAPAIPNKFSNFLSEFVGTMFLVTALLFIGANEFTQGLNPLVVGLLIISIGLSMGGTTGFAINPARDLGPRIAHALMPVPGKGDSGWAYSWIPVIGPLSGGVTGALLYVLLFGN